MKFSYPHPFIALDDKAVERIEGAADAEFLLANAVHLAAMIRRIPKSQGNTKKKALDTQKTVQ